MSAAQWRNAMNAGGGRSAMAAGGTGGKAVTPPRATAGRAAAGPAVPDWRSHVQLRHLLVLTALVLFPWVASPFIIFQIGAQALALGLIALSLIFLGGYGGMVSLAQMTVAGVAGYSVAIFGASGTSEISFGWPWWVVVPLALVIGTLAATAIGWLSVRTEGIYTIMITLAVGTGFYYLCLQNYSVFNGFQGFQQVYPPKLFGINWRDPLPFFYLVLFWSLASYWFVQYLVRAPFGLALQGVRDNPRRMHALGFNVTAHRIAAYTVSGVMAAIGGVLLVWYNGLITPNSAGTSWLINILIIAVLGGMRHPLGPFIGAILFVLLQTFAIDLFDRERFNLVIGSVFLAIVLFSTDGLLGIWAALKEKFSTPKGGVK